MGMYPVAQKYGSDGLSAAREFGAHYNLKAQRFIATTGYVVCNVNAIVPIALMQNPTGSGKWMLFDQSEFGSDVDVRFSRYGGGTAGSLGTARPVGQTDGGSSATSVAKLYIGGSSGAQYAITAAGTLRKVATMKAYHTYQLLNMAGKAILRPGQQLYWDTEENPGGGGTYKVFIDFEWVEIDEAAASALVP